MIFGKAGVAVPVLLAVILAIPDLAKKKTWTDLWRHANTPLGWAIAATAVLWLPGVVFSIRPELSFEAWARTWVFVVVATLFWNILAQTEGLQTVALRAFIIGVAVTLVLSAIGFAVPPFLSLIHAKGWTAENPALLLKQFASAAQLMIPVALWAAFRIGGKWRWVAALEGIGLGWLLVATESRSSMAGLLAMLAIVGIVVALRSRSRRTLIGVGTAIVLAVTAVLGWMYTIPHSAWAPSITRSLNTEVPVWLIDVPRREIWAFTWKKFLESPWIGHGINAVNYLPGADKPIPHMGGILTYIPGHPHNWALEILAETGVIGFTSLVVAAGLLLLRLLIMYRRTGDPAFLATTCVHVGYWVSGLFNFSFWSAWWQISYVLLLALTYPSAQSYPVRQPATPREEENMIREGSPFARAH